MSEQTASTSQCPICQSPYPEKPFIPKRERAEVDEAQSFDCTSLGHYQHDDIFLCSNCGIGALVPLPSEESLAQAYAATVDTTYFEEQEGRLKTFEQSLQTLQRFVSSGQLLEIGSYYGLFLDLATKAGFTGMGVEPSQWACQHAQKELGLEVIHGSWGEALFEQHFMERESSFDAVVSWDVLEHVASPPLFLDLVNRSLKEGGYFAFSTLNINNWWAKLLGKRWPWYMQMHLYYFTTQSLEKLLNAHGFELIYHEPYRQIVSWRYFTHKLNNLSPIKLPIPNRLQSFLKSHYLSFHFGDVVLMVAQKEEGTKAQRHKGTKLN